MPDGDLDGAGQTAVIATAHPAFAGLAKSATIFCDVHVSDAHGVQDRSRTLCSLPIVRRLERGSEQSSGELSMSRTKRTSKRRRQSKAGPVLSAAGLSLTLASGASFATPAPSLDPITRNAAANCEMILRDEEIFDESLATFHVFDNESMQPRRARERLMTFGGGGCCQFACLAGQGSSGLGNSPAPGADAYSRPPRPVRPTYEHVRKKPAG